jgi:prepilin-type processing-associated H-X9-DG protein
MYSDHPNGCNVMFGDGSARFIANSIDRNVWAALSSFNGGEAISGDVF